MDGFSWVDCIITVERAVVKKEMWLDWKLLVAQKKGRVSVFPRTLWDLCNLYWGETARQREIIPAEFKYLQENPGRHVSRPAVGPVPRSCSSKRSL